MSAAKDKPPTKPTGNPAWSKGGPSPNPGGRRRVIQEIEQMLDAEHRTVENMREVFARLKSLAMGEPVAVEWEGEVIRIELRAAPEFMRMYLARLLGPEREIEDIDLSNAPQTVIEWLREQKLVN